MDIYYCLEHYSISEMVEFYRTKYRQESIAHVLKSLIYFEDIDKGDWPVLLQDPQPDWDDIKWKIEYKVTQFVNIDKNSV